MEDCEIWEDLGSGFRQAELAAVSSTLRHREAAPFTRRLPATVEELHALQVEARAWRAGTGTSGAPTHFLIFSVSHCLPLSLFIIGIHNQARCAV